jgi:hypothetical protein
VHEVHEADSVESEEEDKPNLKKKTRVEEEVLTNIKMDNDGKQKSKGHDKRAKDIAAFKMKK